MGTRYDSEAEARKEAKRWMADSGVTGAAIETAIVESMAVRDDEGVLVTDKQGNPEPDTSTAGSSGSTPTASC